MGRPGERALYTLIKERKFGPGCVDAWSLDRERLLGRARHLLAPTLVTLEQQSFSFGATPTLADAASYGNLAMLEAAEPELVDAVGAGLRRYVARLETVAHR